MKKFNKNSLLFVFVIIFIMFGLSLGTIRPILGSIKNILTGSFSIEEAKDNISTVTNEELTYHNLLMDFNSVKENFLSTRVVKKEDTIVVKSDSGSLIGQSKKIDIIEIKNVVKRIDTLKTVSENNGASFLYCAAPTKELYEIAPQNVENHSKENYDLFLSELANSNIPTINSAMNEEDNGIKTLSKTDSETRKVNEMQEKKLKNLLRKLYSENKLGQN